MTAMVLAGAGLASADEEERGWGIKGLLKSKSDVKELKVDIKADGGLKLGAPVLVGKVTAVSSSTITVSGNARPGNASSTFTVDASSATVVKGGATSTVGSIAVGDVITVRGTLSGSNVTAKLIHDGVRRGDDRDDDKDDKPNKPKLVGSGEPVIAGKVTAVSSTTLTVMTNASTTFSVDASHATIKTKGNASSTISAIAVGDQVVIQGSVNGSAVLATTIVDQGDGEGKKGFFWKFRHFFRNLFGL